MAMNGIKFSANETSALIAMNGIEFSANETEWRSKGVRCGNELSWCLHVTVIVTASFHG